MLIYDWAYYLAYSLRKTSYHAIFPQFFKFNLKAHIVEVHIQWLWMFFHNLQIQLFQWIYDKKPFKNAYDNFIYYTLTKFMIYTIQMVLCNVYFQMCLLWKTIKNTSTFKHAYWNEPLKWLTSWTLSMYNVWNVSIHYELPWGHRKIFKLDESHTKWKFGTSEEIIAAFFTKNTSKVWNLDHFTSPGFTQNSLFWLILFSKWNFDCS